jgi:CubicO group peptidase (beta-lactamase class C family)
MTGRVYAAVVLVASTTAFARAGVVARQIPRARPDAVGLSAARLRDATDLLNRYVSEHRIAGAVAAVARRGQVPYLEAVGVQDLETRAPMTERSLFRIYSMTKSVTAVAVMMLHEERRFVLDDSVATFIPEFKNVVVSAEAGTAPRPPARPITVRDLLLHTSGLNHRTSEIYRREQVRTRTMTMTQFIANLVRVPLMEDPGTRYRYSESTTVLGRLVEIWSGKPFEVFLEERIFLPLRMTDTMFWAATPEQRTRLTTVYGPAPGGLTKVDVETLPFTERPTLIEGAVGLLSTVPDCLRFGQMLLNKGELDGVRLLSAKTVEQMTANGLSDDLQQARGGSMGWGLANVNVLLKPAPTDPSSRGEYGWDGTAGTIFWVDPVKQTVTVLMTQSSPSNPDQIRQRFKAIVQQALVE